jgi:hypothetical protein
MEFEIQNFKLFQHKYQKLYSNMKFEIQNQQ